MSPVLPQFLCRLALFIYAIYKLLAILKDTFSERAKMIIAKHTSNTWIALGIGMIMSFIINSSSAVVILVIIFINSRAISLR